MLLGISPELLFFFWGGGRGLGRWQRDLDLAPKMAGVDLSSLPNLKRVTLQKNTHSKSLSAKMVAPAQRATPARASRVMSSKRTETWPQKPLFGALSRLL